MIERAVLGLLGGIAVFWIGAGFWLPGNGVPDWWLPAALVAGLGATSMLPTPAPCNGERAPRWLPIVTACVVAIAFLLMCHGALSTPSRHWDGAASFDAKAYWLTRSPSLQQPFFAAPGVFHHSPGYPILQPLLVAMTERLLPGYGRLVLPLLYLLLVGVVHAALLRRGVHPLVRHGATLAVAVTPALLTHHGGAVDSGYNEVLLLLATTTIAGGLMNRSAAPLALGAALAIWAKPEGPAYALWPLLILFAAADASALRWTALAAVLAWLTWEPLRVQLTPVDDTVRWQPCLLLAGAPLVADRLRLPRYVRIICLALLPVAAIATGAVSPDWTSLPAYFAALFEFGVSRMRLGLTFVLPIAIAAVALLRRVRLGDPRLAALCACGVATTAAPFLLMLEPDLDHHLRSRLPRLLLHWVGPLWLLSACWLDTVLADERRANAHSPK